MAICCLVSPNITIIAVSLEPFPGFSTLPTTTGLCSLFLLESSFYTLHSIGLHTCWTIFSILFAAGMVWTACVATLYWSGIWVIICTIISASGFSFVPAFCKNLLSNPLLAHATSIVCDQHEFWLYSLLTSLNQLVRSRDDVTYLSLGYLHYHYLQLVWYWAQEYTLNHLTPAQKPWTNVTLNGCQIPLSKYLLNQTCR